MSRVHQFQSGAPTNWGNYFFCGDVNKIEDVFRHNDVHNQYVDLWFEPSIAFRGTGPIPSGFTGFEGRAADLLNLTSYTNRDFGRETQQQGVGRTLQFTARLEF